MSLYPIHRSLFSSSSTRIPTLPFSLLLPRLLSSAADRYCRFLRANPNPSHPNLEKTLSLTLSRSASKLDPSTIESVLHRSPSSTSADRSALLRFFVWAGLQPAYRHSAATYGNACELLQISRYPNSIDQLLEVYQMDGTPVSVRTFRILFNLCREADLPDQALRLLRRMGEFNCRPDTPSYNAVLGLLMSSGGGNADVGVRLLEEMALAGVHPDMVTYVSMVKGFCDTGRFEDARGLVARMRDQGCMPNVVVYSSLLDGACKCGNLEAAVELLGEMECGVVGCAPNVVTYTCLIQCLCEKGKVKDAVGVLDRMGRQGCSPNRVTGSTLLKGFCREGMFDEAYKLVERLVGDGSVSRVDCFSSLVVCLLQSERVEEAEKLLRQMLLSSVKPDGLARNALLRELCSMQRFLDGFHWVSEMWKEGLSFDSDVYSSLLAGICEEGHLVEAVTVVRGMIERRVHVDSKCFDGLVELLKKSGETDLALQIMRVRGS